MIRTSRPTLPPAAMVRPWEARPLHKTAPLVEPSQVLPLVRPSTEHPAPSTAPEECPEHRQAELLLQQARAQADQLREQAFREGFENGQARAREEIAAQRQQLRQLADQIGEAYRRFCEEQVSDLAQLAVDVAEKLLRGQLAAEPERVVSLIREALDHVAGSTRIVVHVNPDDLPLVHAHPELCLAPSPGEETQRCLFVADPAVERGGCRIESDLGEVDATLSGSLSRLKAVMENA